MGLHGKGLSFTNSSAEALAALTQLDSSSSYVNACTYAFYDPRDFVNGQSLGHLYLGMTVNPLLRVAKHYSDMMHPELQRGQ